MDFNYSEEQKLMRSTLRKYLTDNYDFLTRQEVVAYEKCWREETWAAFAKELGILGCSIDEAYGGLGGGIVENSIVMEEIGRALAIEPYLETVVIGAGILKRCADNNPRAQELLNGIVTGEVRIALALTEAQSRYNFCNIKTQATLMGPHWHLNGWKAVVSAAHAATHWIVVARTSGEQTDSNGLSMFIVDPNAKGITPRNYPTVDGRCASEVYLDQVSLARTELLGSPDNAWSVLKPVITEAQIALCSEGVGILEQLLSQTVDYAKQRKQFATTLSKFQVIQHRLVDMFIAVEQAKSMALMALLHYGGPDTERYTSAAKAFISKACNKVGKDAIQIHGGMGMSDEVAIGHYFKRATMIEQQYGNRDYHIRRYTALS